jgi:hypothetical protein
MSRLQPGGRPSPKKNVLPSPIAPTEVFQVNVQWMWKTRKEVLTRTEATSMHRPCVGEDLTVQSDSVLQWHHVPDRISECQCVDVSGNCRRNLKMRLVSYCISCIYIHYIHYTISHVLHALHALHALHTVTYVTYISSLHTLHIITWTTCITYGYMNYTPLHDLHTITWQVEPALTLHIILSSPPPLPQPQPPNRPITIHSRRT